MRKSNPKRAVVCGLPVVLLRRGLVGIGAMMLLVGGTIGMLWVVPGLDASILVRYGVVLVLLGSVPGLIAVCVVPWWMIASIQRVVRRPAACLNCGYATIDAATRLCPECGRLDNREDLNRNWKRHLGARDGADAAGGDGGHSPWAWRTVRVDKPDDLARTVRVFWLLGALTVLMYATNFVLFHSGVGSIARTWVAIGLFLVIRGVEWWRWRSYGLPRGTRGELPHPLSFFETLWLVLPAVGMGMGMAAQPGLPGLAYIALIGVPLMATGVVAVWHGLLGTRAGAPVCAGCSYPLAGLRLPGRCPECAAEVRGAEGATERVPDRRPGFVAFGAALLALVGLFVVLVVVAPASMYRALPGPAHRWLAGTQDSAFTALDTDVLTGEQRVRLAERVLDSRRRQDDWRMGGQIDWLCAEIAAGGMPPEVVERFVMEGFGLRILTRGDPGAVVQLAVAGDPPRVDPKSLTLLYFFAGFEIDGGAPVARDDLARDTLDLRGGWSARDAQAERVRAGGGQTPDVSATFMPGPGPVGVRARIVTALYAGLESPTITWHGDGSWTIEPEPLHSGEVEAEVEVGAG